MKKENEIFDLLSNRSISHVNINKDKDKDKDKDKGEGEGEGEVRRLWVGDIIVSVVLTSYNQVSYIDDAIKGILEQKTNFPFEIIVHDDASTDGTQEVLAKYAMLYPEVIVPILRRENIYQKGVSPILEGLKVARGGYIAICEGDDFWISPNKLQAQYDFMEENPRATFSCHNAHIYYVDSERLEVFNPNLASGYYSTADLVLRKWFIPTASLFFRKKIASGTIPEWYGKVRSQDLLLEIILSLKGDFWYQDAAMSVYRKNAIGSISVRKEQPWAYLKLRIELFKKLSSLFPYRLKPLIWIDILLSCSKIIYAKYLGFRSGHE